MAKELGQKNEEIRKYHAEHTVVFNQIRELVGHPGEVVNKARLYDQLVESGDPTSARQTIPILVKYSRMMNNLFAEIQKVIPPGGTPRRVPYPGPPGSPTGTLYEEVGEVAFVQNPPTAAKPSQQGGDSRPGSSGKDPERTRSSGANGRVPDLRGPDVGSHRLLGLQTGIGLWTEPRLLSGTKLRIER
jgi:hypothetical protein